MTQEITYLSILLIVASYFIGCINGAYIFSTNVKKEDIRTYGSGNAGATNALRTYGFSSGLIVFLIDFFKGVICIALSYYFKQSELVSVLCGMACVGGHNWPVTMDFKGGKGVSATGGILIMLNFKLALISILIGASLALITRMVSVGSLTALSLSAILFIVFKVNIYFTGAACILALLSVYQHRANIVRIIHGEENKLTFGKKKD